MSDATALYQALVVERARRPLHAGEVALADGAADGSNPLCGDTVHVTVRRGSDGRFIEVRHRTRACAICSASADLMAESVQGLDGEDVRTLSARFVRLLEQGSEAQEQPDRDALGTLNAFADLHEYRSRRKCAILPWTALVAALGKKDAA